VTASWFADTRPAGGPQVRQPSQKSSAARRWPPSPSVAGLRPQPHLSGSSGRPRSGGTASRPVSLRPTSKGAPPQGAPHPVPASACRLSDRERCAQARRGTAGAFSLDGLVVVGASPREGRGHRPVERQVIDTGTRCASSEEELTVIAQWHGPVHDSCSQRPAPRTDEVRLPGRRPRP
jgi:hypothetical protein